MILVLYQQWASAKLEINQEAAMTTEQIEQYVSNLKQAVINCFSEHPIGSDGVLLVPVDKYNALVEAFNAKPGEQ